MEQDSSLQRWWRQGHEDCMEWWRGCYGFQALLRRGQNTVHVAHAQIANDQWPWPTQAHCLFSWSCTVVSARLIGQFGLILWGETSDGAHFFLVRATEKTKTILDQKKPQKNYRSSKCFCISGIFLDFFKIFFLTYFVRCSNTLSQHLPLI